MSRALVVERHGDMRNALCNLLVGMGIDTIDVEAIEEIDVKSYDFDVIISNISAIRYLTKYHIPILALTPLMREDENNVSYIRQPFEVNDFKNKIESLLQTHV